jgi:glycosyltransferase involved in cell wall biosynthesis
MSERMNISSSRKVLVIYTSSTKGHLSGGEYAFSKIREILRNQFGIKELLVDELFSSIRSKRLRRLLRTVEMPLLVLLSYLYYPRFDLVVTAWTPRLPFYGDVTYLQPNTGATHMFDHPDYSPTFVRRPQRQILRIPNRFLFGPSFNRHYFITNSLYSKNRLREEFGKQAMIVYPPVPVECPKGEHPKEDIVLSIGRIVPNKNFQAIGEVGPSIPKARFLLIGEPGRKGNIIVSYIKGRFSALNLSENFTYMGWVPHETKQKLLQRAKVLFHPSHDESFGISIVEGMANGAIPVVHNSGAPSEYVPSEWLFNNNSEALEKVKTALSKWSPDTGSSMRKIALRFSEDRFKQEMSQAIRQILAKKRER